MLQIHLVLLILRRPCPQLRCRRLQNKRTKAQNNTTLCCQRLGYMHILLEYFHLYNYHPGCFEKAISYYDKYYRKYCNLIYKNNFFIPHPEREMTAIISITQKCDINNDKTLNPNQHSGNYFLFNVSWLYDYLQVPQPVGCTRCI